MADEPFKELSSGLQQKDFKDLQIYKIKQGKDFVQKSVHPTTSADQGMRYSEIWFSDDGVSVRINYKAKNGTVYTLPMTATP